MKIYKRSQGLSRKIVRVAPAPPAPPPDWSRADLQQVHGDSQARAKRRTDPTCGSMPSFDALAEELVSAVPSPPPEDGLVVVPRCA